MIDIVINNTRKAIWILTGLSVTSCLIRNDYNVLFCFLILIILDRYYEENKKLFTKVIIHILTVLIATDIFWLIVIIPYWNSNIQNEYWQSLSGMHSFILVISFIELLLKAPIIAYLVFDFKKNYADDFMDLTKFTYSNEQGIKNAIDGSKINVSTLQAINDK